MSYLILEQLPATKDLAATIGPYWSGIASYVLSALAMVAGSLLKPDSNVPATASAAP